MLSLKKIKGQHVQKGSESESSTIKLTAEQKKDMITTSTNREYVSTREQNDGNNKTKCAAR